MDDLLLEETEKNSCLNFQFDKESNLIYHLSLMIFAMFIEFFILHKEKIS